MRPPSASPTKRSWAATIYLTAPVELHAYSDRLQLRLLLTALNRSQMGQKTSYTYSLEGELQIRQ